MKNGAENLGSGAVTDDRFGATLGYRHVARRDPAGLPGEPPELDPIFPPTGWLEHPGSSFADHPLLRGLLLELPPKSCPPDAAWLERWFDAARAILSLLYGASPGAVPVERR